MQPATHLWAYTALDVGRQCAVSVRVVVQNMLLILVPAEGPVYLNVL